MAGVAQIMGGDEASRVTVKELKEMQELRKI